MTIIGKANKITDETNIINEIGYRAMPQNPDTLVMVNNNYC